MTPQGRNTTVFRRSLLLAAPLAAIARAAPGIARAVEPEDDVSSLTADELALVEQTAAGLEEIEETGGFVLEDGTFRAFDLDAMFAALDDGRSEQKALIAATVSPGSDGSQVEQ